MRICLGMVCGMMVVSALGGCSSAPLIGPETVQGYQPSDLPVPYQFKFDEKKSWAFTKYMDGLMQIRSCVLYYEGDRPVTEVARWYLEQMPKHGWTHENTVDQNGVFLTFVKNNERAEINLKRSADQRGEFFVTKMSAHIGYR